MLEAARLVHARAPPGRGDGPAVLGDGQVLEPAAARRLHHGLQGVAAVALRGVRVQVALDVLHLDQPGQAPRLRGRHLAPVLAQLRRYEGQAQGAVDVLLRGARDLRARLHLEHAVLVQLQLPPHRALADGDVVGLGAGEVLERRAQALGGERAQVHLEPRGQDHAGLGGPADQHLLDLRLGHEGLGQRGGVAQDQQVEVAHGLAPAAVGPHGLHAQGAVVAEVARQPGHRGVGLGEEEADRGPQRLFQALADACLLLLLHPRQRPEAAVGDGRLEVPRARHAQPGPDQVHAARAQARDAQQLEQPGGDLGQQVLVERAAPRLQELPDLGLDALAHARQAGQRLAAPQDLADVVATALHRFRSHPVGADAERVVALDVQEVGDLVQDAADLPVVHEGIMARLLLAHPSGGICI